MSDNDQDNKFKEELTKELESGFHVNADGSGGGDDFTVKVRREEYIVKRRFYDKDKALEEAESLRKDKRNLVEDNIEGQAFSSDQDIDEKVDWDKLVDAGLVFDPPIAHAAEKQPGEPHIGLADALTPKTVIDDKQLEKTLVVKRPKKAPLLKTEDEPEENVEFEGEDISGVSKTSSKAPWVLVLLVVLAMGGGAYYFFSSSAVKSPKEPAVQVQKIKPIPARPAATAAQEKKPVTSPMAEARKETTIQKAITPPEKTVPVGVAKPERQVAEQNIEKPKKTPPPPPEPKQVSPEVEDHFTHTVHVSSYRSQERAHTAAIQLNKKGYAAFSGVISIPGKGEWYRVYAGYVKDLDAATAMANRIKKDFREDAVARKTLLAIQIGDTAPASQVGQLLTNLDKKGYSANAVPVAPKSNVVRILTGAFKSEAEASTMLSFLKRDGFSARIVER